MIISLPYGTETAHAHIDWARALGVLDIAETPPLADADAVLCEGFRNPIGMPGPCLKGFNAGDSVAIVVSDSFRHTGMEQLLPRLVHEVLDAGIRAEDIFFVYSTGTHRGPTEDEAARILGPEIYGQFKAQAFAHDPFDSAQNTHVGTTRRGTPVWINTRVHRADHVIVTGTVVLHYFGGFGGGRKSVVPGIAGVETIAHNHALNLHGTDDRLDPNVRIGVMRGNPVAEDMMEAAAMQPVDFMVNTVLNRHGKIAGIFTGELGAAHAAAADFAHGLYVVPIREQADFVIASAGGAKNFIQSHKALFNAYQAVKPDGRIIFLAPAPEGFGGNKFAQWLALGTRERVIQELRKHAEINGQTALSTLEKARISHIVSELSGQEIAALGGTKAASLSDALDAVRAELSGSSGELTFFVLPSASFTVPMRSE